MVIDYVLDYAIIIYDEGPSLPLDKASCNSFEVICPLLSRSTLKKERNKLNQ